MQIRQAASGLELTEEQFVELQSQHWGRFYSICVQYQQVAYPLSLSVSVSHCVKKNTSSTSCSKWMHVFNTVKSFEYNITLICNM